MRTAIHATGPGAFLAIASELRAVPAGRDTHPGLRPHEVTALARRIGALAGGLYGQPRRADRLRTVAGELVAQYGAAGLPPAETEELAAWFAEWAERMAEPAGPGGAA
ncbi:MAG TPA: hypothetical protein VD995_02845 [Azospirillum sp.]|nr:hypothetical protein [Azospirillum sp.]